MGKKILFKFILPPMTKDINILKDTSIFQVINVISKQIRNRKEKQIMFLKQDLKHKRIEEQLKDPLLQQKIKNFQEKIELEICANIPNAFCIERIMLSNYLMNQTLMRKQYRQKLGLFK
jgi:heme oxygenase